MKCLRCGYCCVQLEVVIVAPAAVRPNLRIEELSPDDFLNKHTGEVCPHLRVEDGEASCNIHHYEFYKHTPCYQHSQIESGDSPCRIGEGVRSGKVNWKISRYL